MFWCFHVPDDNFIEKEGGCMVRTSWLRVDRHLQQEKKNDTVPPWQHTVRSTHKPHVHTYVHSQPSSYQHCFFSPLSLLICWVSPSPLRCFAFTRYQRVQKKRECDGRNRVQKGQILVWGQSTDLCDLLIFFLLILFSTLLVGLKRRGIYDSLHAWFKSCLSFICMKNCPNQSYLRQIFSYGICKL